MCGTTGALVSSRTVENIVIENIEEGTLKYEILSLCMDKKCEMAYFSADYGYLYLQSGLKTPLDYKADVEIRYVCYCKKITVSQLKVAVLEEGAKTIKDVFRFHSPVIVEECKTKNPFGYCCMPDIKKMIDDIRLGIEI